MRLRNYTDFFAPRTRNHGFPGRGIFISKLCVKYIALSMLIMIESYCLKIQEILEVNAIVVSQEFSD